jgi:hypothetical protein
MIKVKLENKKVNVLSVCTGIRSGMVCEFCNSLCDSNLKKGTYTPEQYEYCKSLCDLNHC